MGRRIGNQTIKGQPATSQSATGTNTTKNTKNIGNIILSILTPVLGVLVIIALLFFIGVEVYYSLSSCVNEQLLKISAVITAFLTFCGGMLSYFNRGDDEASKVIARKLNYYTAALAFITIVIDKMQ